MSRTSPTKRGAGVSADAPDAKRQALSPVVGPASAPEGDAEMGEVKMDRPAFVAKPVKEFPISVLRETDVLSGRGSNVCVFPGNILFRNYINDLRDEYQTAQRKQKMVIATRVCNLVLDSGGRFLEKHESPNVYAWKLLPHDKVLEKCSQALREKNRWSAVKGK